MELMTIKTQDGGELRQLCLDEGEQVWIAAEGVFALVSNFKDELWISSYTDQPVKFGVPTGTKLNLYSIGD